MAQYPAVVIIARHGPRLDAADQSWHLSTPTPYDPPLTYAGWNQSRALGGRIASLLEARETSEAQVEVSEKEQQRFSKRSAPDGVTAYDFASQDTITSGKRRKRKQKVVIHTSPFLRCVQTSVAIAAGMAQYRPTVHAGAGSGTRSRPKTPSSLHSASPRLRASDGAGSPTLAPISEPKHGLAQEIARRVLDHKPKYRRAKLRVDAFLGEWLNPQYFDQITPPPPSAMMVATAKAELVHSEPIDNYTPTLSNKSSNSNLWGGSSGQRSRDSTLDDTTLVQDTIPTPPSSRRERASSVSSVESNESESGLKHTNGRRRHRGMQGLASTTPIATPESATYVAPVPHYAISGSDRIPRGYVGHARQACVNVDYHWDSSRPPQNWVDGGEYGEGWSAMHRRLRKGFNHLIQWYSQHNADDRAEDSLSLEQVEKHHESEQEEPEELVIILVTHGAGSNALIGALTGQPVLLDVGMASLTMAVRRDDAPRVQPNSPSEINSKTSPNSDYTTGHPRRRSVDLGLSAVYEMKLISSSEHLRPSADATRRSSFNASANHGARAALPRFRDSNFQLHEPIRSSTSSSLGTIRRPSAGNVMAVRPAGLGRSESTPSPVVVADNSSPTTSPLAPGLWSPMNSGTPLLQAQMIREERKSIFSMLNDPSSGRTSPTQHASHGFTDLSFEDHSDRGVESRSVEEQDVSANQQVIARADDLDSSTDPRPPNGTQKSSTDHVELAHPLPPSGVDALPALGEGISHKGLWDASSAGAKVERKFPLANPKRRWTVDQNSARE